jgi:regulator of sigma E protease
MPFALISILSMLAVLGIMVLIHEAGHFITAKLCGVRVEVFSIGFGPRLFGFQRGDTDYRICLLPLGGYVKMAGELPGEESSGDPAEFTARPRWQRILIGLSGPAANFLLAFALMTGLYMMHNEVDAYLNGPAIVDFVPQHTAASAAGLQGGDRILQFGTVKNPDWQQINIRMGIDGNATVPVTYTRDGASPTTVQLPLAGAATSDGPDPLKLGLDPRIQSEPLSIADVEAGFPLAKAGIKAGDQLNSINGLILHSVSSVAAYLQQNGAHPVTLAVKRGPETITATVMPVLGDDGTGKIGYRLGFRPKPPPFSVEQQSLPSAAAHSYHYNVQNSGYIVEVLRKLFSRHSPAKQLMGPVGIAKVTGEAVTMPGWQPIINLMAMISLNLGIFNLLPFPILDGGMILLLVIESIMRHDLNPEVKERIYQVAIVVLVLFFVFVTFNDVSRLIGFSKI